MPGMSSHTSAHSSKHAHGHHLVLHSSAEGYVGVATRPRDEAEALETQPTMLGKFDQTVSGVVKAKAIGEKSRVHTRKLMMHRCANDPDLRQEAQASFDSAQTLLGQLITMSSLLLGFIVTGSMLSISMTGEQNYGVQELVTYMVWAGIAALAAAMSLLLAFVSSVRGSAAMEMQGVFVAEYVITNGSAFMIVTAEMLIYSSLAFFLGSMKKFLTMVYTGPSFCPSYQGSASQCARLGKGFYMAAKSYCNKTFGLPAPPCVSAPSSCLATTPALECLCAEYCSLDWESVSSKAAFLNPSLDVRKYDYFGYQKKRVQGWTEQSRWKLINSASSLDCLTLDFQNAYSSCRQRNPGQSCGVEYHAWQKAVDCEQTDLVRSNECGKVCDWGTAHKPPRRAVVMFMDVGIIPVGVLLALLMCGRITTLMFRCLRSMRSCQDFKENFGWADLEREMAHRCYDVDNNGGDALPSEESQ